MSSPAAVASAGSSRLSGWLLYLLVLGAATCWGSLGIAYALILDGVAISPITLVLTRAVTACAALFLYLVAARRELLRVRRRDLPFLVILGLIYVTVFYPALIYAFQLTSVAIGTVLLYLSPAITALIAARWLGEGLTRRKLLALGLCLGGAILVVQPWQGASLRTNALGIGLGLLSALTYAGYNTLAKHGLRRHHPLTLILYALALGSLGMLPLQLVAGSGLPGLRTTALICLVTGLLMTLAPLALFTVALTHLPAGNAAIVATFEPVVSITLAALILGQFLAPAQFAGAALIIGGVFVLTMGKGAA